MSAISREAPARSWRPEVFKTGGGAKQAFDAIKGDRKIFNSKGGDDVLFQTRRLWGGGKATPKKSALSASEGKFQRGFVFEKMLQGRAAGAIALERRSRRGDE